MKALELMPVCWRKSTHSGDTGGDCVELAAFSSGIAVRDSKNPEAPHLTFGRAAFGEVLKEIRANRHGL